ncbi:cupin domain-containing protein [Streptomyces sp. SS7]|uniref:cupin domain-containing protein n=1 Tax=Streptomyces sp. SS7 TaxID=3108485 RepID=UPI0030EDCA1A
MEWELRGESRTDEHPHDELHYVLQGHLFVRCDGETTDVSAGDLVLVPAGAVGTYWAPRCARMLAVYGPAPQGRPSRVHGYERILPGPDDPCPS